MNTSIPAFTVGPVTLAVLMMQILPVPQAFAQSTAAVRPLFGVSRTYDSNLFASADRPEGFFVMRMTPGVEAERRSPVWGLLGRYTVDLEHVTGPSSVPAAVSGQSATALMRHQLSRRATASVDASFTRTRTPGRLNPVPGLTLGRITAERLDVHPKIVRDLDGRMSGTVEYTFTRDRAAGIGEMLSHRTAVGIDRQVSRRDAVGVTYDLQRMAFDVGGNPVTHRVSAGWNRPLTRVVKMSVQAGAAATGSMRTPEIQALIEHRLRSTEVALTYGRTQTTIIGFAGVMDTESLAAAGTLYPRRGLVLRLAPAVSRMRQGSSRIDAWRLGFDVARRVPRGEVRVLYEASGQRGALSDPLPAGSVLRQVVQVGFTFSATEASCDTCNTQGEQ